MNQLTVSSTLALIAHDARKQELLSFAEQHREALSHYRLIATSTTGGRLANVLGLSVECKLSGPLGGDAQIASEVALGHVRAVIFLIDPLCAQPHEADIQSLLRLCNVHNVAVATNVSAAELLMKGLAVHAQSATPRVEPAAFTSGRASAPPPHRTHPLQSRPRHSRPTPTLPLNSRPTQSHPLNSPPKFESPLDS